MKQQQNLIYEGLEMAQKRHCEPNPKVGKRTAWKQFPQPAVYFGWQMNGRQRGYLEKGGDKVGSN